MSTSLARAFRAVTAALTAPSDPAPSAPTLAYCETSSATTFSPHHVRLVGPEGLKRTGGAPGSALCGRDLHGGWDLRTVTLPELQEARVDPDPDWPGHTCRACRDVAFLTW